ncbi:hypothetical protein J6590_092292 [Homalodisca vitripennis]|nr:hypothetical protein J6590_092292 [Homalodisca vitripennis]
MSLGFSSGTSRVRTFKYRTLLGREECSRMKIEKYKPKHNPKVWWPRPISGLDSYPSIAASPPRQSTVADGTQPKPGLIDQLR